MRWCRAIVSACGAVHPAMPLSRAKAGKARIPGPIDVDVPDLNGSEVSVVAVTTQLLDALFCHRVKWLRARLALPSRLCNQILQHFKEIRHAVDVSEAAWTGLVGFISCEGLLPCHGASLINERREMYVGDATVLPHAPKPSGVRTDRIRVAEFMREIFHEALAPPWRLLPISLFWFGPFRKIGFLFFCLL
jgi:hypothetical protein